ncbi:UNVERIFIED_CONTAM: hypothetical protein K2H54_044533 [Gekko kuhli]
MTEARDRECCDREMTTLDGTQTLWSHCCLQSKWIWQGFSNAKTCQTCLQGQREMCMHIMSSNPSLNPFSPNPSLLSPASRTGYVEECGTKAPCNNYPLKSHAHIQEPNSFASFEFFLGGEGQACVGQSLLSKIWRRWAGMEKGTKYDASLRDIQINSCQGFSHPTVYPG